MPCPPNTYMKSTRCIALSCMLLTCALPVVIKKMLFYRSYFVQGPKSLYAGIQQRLRFLLELIRYFTVDCDSHGTNHYRKNHCKKTYDAHMVIKLHFQFLYFLFHVVIPPYRDHNKESRYTWHWLPLPSFYSSL